MADPTGAAKDTMGFLVDEFPALSNSARTFVRDPELAWAFLSQEWPFDDTVTAPLTLLKAGRMDDVLGAAAGFGTTFA